jgi:REP-associated tyrosine transposase
MDDYESLSHSKWECKYHVVFIPKCRRKTLYVELRRHLGEVFRKLAEQKESRIEVSTVGRDTEVIRDYIKRQEEEDKRLEQMNLWR